MTFVFYSKRDGWLPFAEPPSSGIMSAGTTTYPVSPEHCFGSSTPTRWSPAAIRNRISARNATADAANCTQEFPPSATASSGDEENASPCLRCISDQKSYGIGCGFSGHGINKYHMVKASKPLHRPPICLRPCRRIHPRFGIGNRSVQRTGTRQSDGGRLHPNPTF